MLQRRFRSASPLLRGIAASVTALAGLWAVLVLLLEIPISWAGACLVSLLIGAAVFDRARGNGQTTEQRLLARQPRGVRVVISFVFGALLLWALPLTLGMERLSWIVVLGTAALVTVHGELVRADEAQQKAGRHSSWSRQDKLMLGISTMALVVYSLAFMNWGLPTGLREWLAMGFVWAFPVAMLLWVFFRPRGEPTRPRSLPSHPSTS